MSFDITLNAWEPPASDTAWDRVRLEFSQTGDPTSTDWTQDAAQAIAIDPTPEDPDPVDIASSGLPWIEGYVRVVFIHPDDSESVPSSPIYTMVTWNGGLLGLVPRTRRAIEGFEDSALSDGNVRDLLADAVAEIIFYAPQWGKRLVVTSRSETNVPTDYEVTPELSLPEQTVVVAQAALNFFFHKTGGGKTSEKISDEGQSWEIQSSAQMLVKIFDQLKKARDEALKQLEDDDVLIAEGFVSFIAVRDCETSRNIEGYYHAGGGGGLQLDYRFGA